MTNSTPAHHAAADGCPKIDRTDWGYVLRPCNERARANRLAAIGGKFLGAILLFAAAGLWVMPDALLGADVFAMKLAAMVMFSVFGGWLFWAGQQGTELEYQVDTTHSELRVGSSDLRGKFQIKATLAFSDIASVYLLRSKDRSQPTRLFLRIGSGNQALEVASGSEARLEALRDRLAHDLAQRSSRPQRPVSARLTHQAALPA